MTSSPDMIDACALLRALSEGAPESRPILLDGRSPSEFAQGHIPGAHSFPLFTDDERAQVGKRYHDRGTDAAVELGLELVGPKLSGFVSRARSLSDGRPILLHCWRGGMRSASLAWLLRTAGFQVRSLRGGYKAYRRLVLEELAHRGELVVLGGRTGSGKTEALRALAELGTPVIDLEGIADHYGSAFGNLDDHPQPTNEQFANEVHRQLRLHDAKTPVWIEDESRSIGRVWQPEEWFQRIRNGRVVVLERSLDERVRHLEQMYGSADRGTLAEAFSKIRKRLGGQNEQAAQRALSEDDLATAARIALRYYDKAYDHGLETRAKEQLTPVDGRGLSFEEIAQRLRDLSFGG